MRRLLCIKVLLAIASALTVAHAETITVRNGESIVAAIGNAKDGDTVRVMPGTYHETVYADQDGITLTGVIVDGEWPLLDGQGELSDAVLMSGNGIVIENLRMTNYRSNGIMLIGSKNFAIRNNIIEQADEGIYGIFPQFVENGVIERNIVTGVSDAGIYVAMSNNVDIILNEVYGNVFGIELENSRDLFLARNSVHDNVAGVLSSLLPGLPVKSSGPYIIRDNFIFNNNKVNYHQGFLRVIPTGVGVMILSGDESSLEGNVIYDNDTAGVVVVTQDRLQELGYMNADPTMERDTDRNRVLANLFYRNGSNPGPSWVRDLLDSQKMKIGVDVFDAGGGKENCLLNRNSISALATDNWQDCDEDVTVAAIHTLQLDAPVTTPPIVPEDTGSWFFGTVCSGCHSTTTATIGPAVSVIKALYADRPEELASWIAEPTRKREGFPTMPPQAYLSETVRLAVANHILYDLEIPTKK